MTRTANNTAALGPYLAHLEKLPFVSSARLRDARSINDPNSKALTLTTPRGEQRAFLNWARSNLNQQLVEYLVHLAGRLDGPFFLFAPSVGREVATRLEEACVNYVDLAGNCGVQLGDEYIAQIEGRRLPAKTPRERALRAPSLLVLFTLLAKPELVSSPVRLIASKAGGLSPQTVTDLRKRLVEEEWVSAAGRKHAWVPGGKERALDLLLGDYDRLALHLKLGRFRARPMDLGELEQAITERLKGRVFSFGGGAALERSEQVKQLKGYYRGTRTIVYADEALPSMTGLLVPDARGEIIFSRFPGECARNENQDLSPLLIYLDLMTEGEPRAREAAAELRPTLFAGDEDES